MFLLSGLIYLVSYLPQLIDKKSTKIAWMTTVKKIINQSGNLENSTKFNCQPVKLFGDRRLQFVTILLSAF